MRETPSGIILSIKAQPGASLNEFAGLQGDALKIRVTAPPSDSAANKALIRLLSKTINIPRSKITIVKGSASRNKQVLLSQLGIQDLDPIFLKSCRAQ